MRSYKMWGLILLSLGTCGSIFAQSPHDQGDVELHMQLYQTDSTYRHRMDQLEASTYRRATDADATTDRSLLTIPVAIHVMHLPGDGQPGEGSYLSEARVRAGLERLNEAFRDQGVYAGGPFYSDAKPRAGIEAVDTEIEFCLATKAPNGQFAGGLQYVPTALSDVHFGAWYASEGRSEDAALKARSVWDSNDYLNIWLVNSVCKDIGEGCDQRGYAYLPGAHGTALDGVVVESAYWGTAADSMQIPIFYIGRYLNLWATSFRSINTLPCTNDQCLQNGDRVCDTPPDSSQGGPGCMAVENSCTSDGDDDNAGRNPFIGLDLEDIWENYMDLGPEPACVNTFTAGQRLRMRETITTARSSLLNGDKCVPAVADCIIPDQIPDQPGLYRATARCTDSLGWTHFFKAATDSPGIGQALLLASFRSPTQIEQTWAPTDIEMVLTSGYGQAGHDLSAAPYVENNSGWMVSGRYVRLAPGLIGQPVLMRLLYDGQDLADLDQALIPAVRQGPLALTPYAIDLAADPLDGHQMVPAEQFRWYEAFARGHIPQWASWTDGPLQAAVVELSDAQTVGLGTGGLGRGYGPLYPGARPRLNGVATGEAHALTWDTQREWDLQDFEIMQSRNGAPFTLLGRLPALQDSLAIVSARSYDWRADSLPEGQYRYFVVARHGSGWTLHSDTLTLDQADVPEVEVRLFPNPAQRMIKVAFDLDTDTHVRLQIMDATRRALRQYQWVQQPGMVKSLSLAELPTGIYFYQIAVGTYLRQGKLLVYLP